MDRLFSTDKSKCLPVNSTNSEVKLQESEAICRCDLKALQVNHKSAEKSQILIFKTPLSCGPAFYRGYSGTYLLVISTSLACGNLQAISQIVSR